mmetsp:Transcript_2630/g.8090  ORF Transcript_2630/g.8090 Transcript_2630/m.8090 type:complete len:227 (+) Transcript_2630:1079-1759(+)
MKLIALPPSRAREAALGERKQGSMCGRRAYRFSHSSASGAGRASMKNSPQGSSSSPSVSQRRKLSSSGAHAPRNSRCTYASTSGSPCWPSRSIPTVIAPPRRWLHPRTTATRVTKRWRGASPQTSSWRRERPCSRCDSSTASSRSHSLSSACIDAASARATSPAPPPAVCGVCASATKAETARYIHPISHSLATACITPGASEAAAAAAAGVSCGKGGPPRGRSAG